MPDVATRLLPPVFQELLETRKFPYEAEATRLDAEIDERRRRRAALDSEIDERLQRRAEIHAEMDAELADLHAKLTQLAEDPLVQELLDLARFPEPLRAAKSGREHVGPEDATAAQSGLPPADLTSPRTHMRPPHPAEGAPAPVPDDRPQPPPALSARIAAIMGTAPDRSWETSEMVALLFDDPADRQNKRKRDTVGKTLTRMVGRGEAARSEDGRYTPGDQIRKALRHQDTRGLRLVPGDGRAQTPTEEPQEAMRIAT